MNIEALAAQAGISIPHADECDMVGLDQLHRFVTLIREAVVQELVAGSGEPVAWMWKDGTITSDPDRADGTWTPLYTADQLAGAVLRERQKAVKLWMLLDDVDTADDIAKADDKLYRGLCQQYQKKRWEILSGDEVDAAAIRSGK